MFCKRCTGRVMVDSIFSENNHIELFCIRCGKRWMVDKVNGVFGAWLDRKARSTI
jgi:hypothetical protein